MSSSTSFSTSPPVSALAKSQEHHEQPAKGMHSLYEVCQQVVDGRRARGKRYELASLLVVLVLAKLAGMQSLQGASDWIADQEALLREGLQLSWKRMPCASTYSYALARLDSQHVNEDLAAWCVRKEAESRCGEEPSRLAMQASEQHEQVAIDGKALRGTGKQLYGGEEPQKQVLHVYEVQSGIVLQQCPTLKPLLTEALCKGRILTSDAGKPLPRVWTAGQTGGRRRGGVRQRQYAQHPRRPGTLF